MPETDRLRLHPPRLDDAPALFGFLGDAEAMRHTHVLRDQRACRRYVAAHMWHGRRNMYGPWTIRDTSGGIIGFGGLYQDPFDPGWGVEIGYFFAPSVWGRGYATELVRFCLADAGDQLGLREIAAFVHPDNAASRRVLEKSGFTIERFLTVMDRYLLRWRLPPSAAQPGST